MPEVRLIDANALIKDIAESIRLADEWEKESSEKKDKHGLKLAIGTRRSLMSMISRIKEAPTIEPEVRHGNLIPPPANSKALYRCSECGVEICQMHTNYCGNCGVMLEEGADNGS